MALWQFPFCNKQLQLELARKSAERLILTCSQEWWPLFGFVLQLAAVLFPFDETKRSLETAASIRRCVAVLPLGARDLGAIEPSIRHCVAVLLPDLLVVGAIEPSIRRYVAVLPLGARDLGAIEQSTRRCAAVRPPDLRGLGAIEPSIRRCAAVLLPDVLDHGAVVVAAPRCIFVSVLRERLVRHHQVGVFLVVVVP